MCICIFMYTEALYWRVCVCVCEGQEFNLQRLCDEFLLVERDRNTGIEERSANE